MTEEAVLRQDFSEVEDLTAQLRGIAADAVPLVPGSFAASLASVHLGDVVVQVVRGAPLLLLGTAKAGMTGLIQVLEGSAKARWNGRRIAVEEIALCSGRNQHEAAYQEAFACTVISFATAEHAEGGAVAGGRAPGPDAPIAALRPEADARAILAAIGRAIEEATATGCAALRDAEARRSLRATILDIVRGMLAVPEAAGRAQARLGRSRQRIVHAADAYLRANLARPVYTDELCVALGVSATSLHQAFHATVGISPHRYLKMRRMGMVRAALLSLSGPWHSVKAIALSHGFWHLGQFCLDYRAMYGETPSGTLARVHGAPLRRGQRRGGDPVTASAARHAPAMPAAG